jgi:hypothetical protein
MILLSKHILLRLLQTVPGVSSPSISQAGNHLTHFSLTSIGSDSINCTGLRNTSSQIPLQRIHRKATRPQGPRSPPIRMLPRLPQAFEPLSPSEAKGSPSPAETPNPIATKKTPLAKTTPSPSAAGATPNPKPTLSPKMKATTPSPQSHGLAAAGGSLLGVTQLSLKP